MSLQDKGRNNMMLSNSRTQTAADAKTLKAVRYDTVQVVL